MVTALSSVVTYLYNEVRKLRSLEENCRVRLARLESELVSLNAVMEQMRWTGDVEIDGVVVADMGTGLILEWNPGATLLLHWTAREMFGKPVTRIIPERYQKDHLRGMEEVRTKGRPPKHGPYQAHALTKEGAEVPVEIRLSGWTVGDQRMVGAVIRRRREESGHSVVRLTAGATP